MSIQQIHEFFHQTAFFTSIHSYNPAGNNNPYTLVKISEEIQDKGVDR